MIKGLTHIALRVTDIKRSIDFYLRIPGITESFTLKADDGSIILVYLKVADRQFVELFPGADGQHVPPVNSGCVHFCLEVDDIHEMHKSVIANGLTPNGEPFLAIDNTWQFWVSDPDGNPIEFHQFSPESMQLQD
ncbi:MAG: VOC family protein [Armatimonadota bacterium]